MVDGHHSTPHASADSDIQGDEAVHREKINAVFASPDRQWQDLTKFHKTFVPGNGGAMHPYDMVQGPFFARFSAREGLARALPRRDQISIHARKAADISGWYRSGE